MSYFVVVTVAFITQWITDKSDMPVFQEHTTEDKCCIYLWRPVSERRCTFLVLCCKLGWLYRLSPYSFKDASCVDGFQWFACDPHTLTDTMGTRQLLQRFSPDWSKLIHCDAGSPCTSRKKSIKNRRRTWRWNCARCCSFSLSTFWGSAYHDGLLHTRLNCGTLLHSATKYGERITVPASTVISSCLSLPGRWKLPLAVSFSFFLLFSFAPFPPSHFPLPLSVCVSSAKTTC